MNLNELKPGDIISNGGKWYANYFVEEIYQNSALIVPLDIYDKTQDGKTLYQKSNVHKGTIPFNNEFWYKYTWNKIGSIPSLVGKNSIKL